jgi:hypothetical protein
MQEKNTYQHNQLDASVNVSPTVARGATWSKSTPLLHFGVSALSGCQSLTIFRKRYRDRSYIVGWEATLDA